MSQRAIERAARRWRGFTIVELIVIMVVVGVMGALAAPRFFARAGFDARAFADQTRAQLRYAQKLAIAQNRPVWVRLNGASIALCFDNACTSPVFAPAGNNSASDATLAACGNSRTWYCEALPSGVGYAAFNLGTAFYFDALGKPFAVADVQPTLVSTFAPRVYDGASGANLAVTKLVLSGDGASFTVAVEPDTGYVH